MKTFPVSALLVATALLGLSAASAKPPPEKKQPAKPHVVTQDEAVRMQIFLDDHNFGPGKIDGNFGGFTLKSWQYYQRAQGESAPKDTFDVKSAPLATNNPLYTSYTITASDVAAVGALPPKLAEQAKGKSMPYASMGELLGERYHSAVKFLATINPGKNLDGLKEGDQVTVPNIARPFNVADVEAKRQAIRDAAQKAREEAENKKKEAAANAEGAKKKPKATPNPSATPSFASDPHVVGPSPSPAPGEDAPAPPPPEDPARRMIHVSVKDAYLEVHDGDKVVAGFPITPGSTAIPSPKGEWKIESKTLLPEFRWDKEMLLHGQRSSDFYQIPPGPNNPVGVTWIALNKKGIGLHGTNDPETIGRAASHGCIRLANWDAFKLFDMVQKGEKVVIE